MTGGVLPSGQAGDGLAPSVAIFVAGQRGVQVRHALLKPLKKAQHAVRPCWSMPSHQLRPAPRANVLTQLERRLRACVQGLRRDHFAVL